MGVPRPSWAAILVSVLVGAISYLFFWHFTASRPSSLFISEAVDLLSAVSLSEDSTVSKVKLYKPDLGVGHSDHAPDTTAIVLNWSRLPNVIRIASLLCDEALDHAIARVVIWNNNPHPLTIQDFASSRCVRDDFNKLEIVNSPHNLYFQARFLACSQSDTEYCFIQDDDFVIWPEVINALHHKFREMSAQIRSLYLLPPHEHLSSQLQTISVPPHIHTSFSWLGYGSILRRSAVTDFMALLHKLNATEEEFKMADNYFSILSNTYAQLWFDQGFELGGGQPFTVGSEGNARNQRHIIRAAEMLDSLMDCNGLCQADMPYVSHDPTLSSPHQSHYAPCRGRPCVLETDIQLLPAAVANVAARYEALVGGPVDVGAKDLLSLAQSSAELLGDQMMTHYVLFPLSKAVDGQFDTFFQSTFNARQNDSIIYDVLSEPSPSLWHACQLVLLVDLATRHHLEHSIYEVSNDHMHETWAQLSLSSLLACSEVGVPNVGGSIWECSINVPMPTPRYHRIRLLRSGSHPWVLHEIWFRGLFHDEP